MMARMTPVSLHFSDVPTGWKKIFTDKQQLATGFACSSRTVRPDEHCYRLICASCTQFHVPLGTQAFQLPQAASKQRSVPWWCRCGMFATFTTAAIRLLRSIFIWAPPRTRPKFQHLCAHTRDSQRSRCSARRCNISWLPLSSKHVLCFWLFFWYISDDDDDASTETFTERRSQSAAPLGDLSCKQRCANIVAMEMLKNRKSAQDQAQYHDQRTIQCKASALWDTK